MRDKEVCWKWYPCGDNIIDAFRRGLGDLKWCFISETTVYSWSAGEGFKDLVLSTCIKKVGGLKECFTVKRIMGGGVY